MVRHKRGGADEAFTDPAVDAALDGMVQAAVASSSKGGARPRRPSMAAQPSLPPASDAAAVVPPPPPPAPPAPPSVFKKGLTTLLKDIDADVKQKRDKTEQLLVDGLAMSYRAGKAAVGVGAMGLLGQAAPPAVRIIMRMGKTVLDNLPAQTWSGVYETWKDAFSGVGDVAQSAASFATTPNGALMMGGLLVSIAARGAGKSVPEYLKDIGSAAVGSVGEKVKAVVGNIKTELDRVATKNPAADLNAEVKARLKEKETKEAMDAYLALAAEKAEREAAEALLALPAAPSGGRRRKSTKKKRTVKRRVTRRFVY